VNFVGSFAALLLLLAGTAQAQDNKTATNMASKGLAQSATATIEVIDGGELRLYDSISFYVRISLDKSAKSALDLSEAKVTLQGPATTIYGSTDATDSANAATRGTTSAKSSESARCQLTTSSIDVGESAVVATCVLDRAEVDAGELSWLVIRPKVDAFVTVTVEQAGTGKPIRVTAPIEMRPPLHAPYLGGCVGALALAALAGLWRFRTSRRLLKARAKFSKAGWSTKAFMTLVVEVTMTGLDLFFFFLSEWGFASITAFVFIIMGQSTSVAGAPIQVTVTNFWGGVAVGLLAFPLNKWLLEKLGLTTPKARPA
jgi:hypothetical protein